MPDVFFARRPCAPAQLIHRDEAALERFIADNGFRNKARLTAGTAYSPACQNSQDRCIVRGFNSSASPEQLNLLAMVDALGDETPVLAAFIEKNLNSEALRTMNGLVGAGATASSHRLNGFQNALLKYETALLQLRQSAGQHGRGVGHGRHMAKQQVKQSYQRLNTAYTTELGRLAPLHLRGKNRGNALSNSQRGITLATRSPHANPDPRLQVGSLPDAKRLQSLSRFMNHTGKAAVVLDGSLRGHGIYQTYQEEGDWMREASVQMAGFGAGGAAGGVMGKAVISGGTAMAAKSGLILAGPMGWAVLGVIVGAGLVSGFAVGSAMDKQTQRFAGWTWRVSANAGH